MSMVLGLHEWLPANCDGGPITFNPDDRLLPLGHCKTWGTDDTGLFFEVGEEGDPEWMRHVFNTLHGLGVAFLAGIHRCLDKNDLQRPEVLQFCVILSRDDAAEFMPRVMQAYDIAEAVTEGKA